MSSPPECRGFDPHDRDYALDPWAVFKRLRAECPLSYSNRYEGGFWVLAKYEDVKAAALDPARYSSEKGGLIPSSPLEWALLPIMADPPLTAEYRRLLNHMFSVAAVKKFEPTVRGWVVEAIDAFASRGSCEWVSELAYPVPGKVTVHQLGWPIEDWELVMRSIKQFTTRGPEESERWEAKAAVEELRGRVGENIAHRQAESGDDLASRLLEAEVEGRRLREDEIVALMMMVIFGGVDTTVAAIGNMLHYLDLDRELRDRLIADPSLIPVAVEELLRYEPPIQLFARTPREPSVIRGQEIRAGEKVALLWGSANHDEDVFPDPETVRLDRGSNPHLTFGVGVHRCQGATLARMELRVVLEEVLARIPDYRIVHDEVVHTYSAGTVFERLSLPAVFTPRPPLGRVA